MVKHYPLLFFFALFIFMPVKSQQVKPFTNISNNYLNNTNMISEVKKIVCDAGGNMYVYLKSYGKLTVKGKEIHDHIEGAEQVPSYLIVKLSKKGNYQWGIASQQPISDFDCDPSGNLYIAVNDNSGNKVSSMAFYSDNAALMAQGSNNLIFRLNANGDYAWSKKMGSDFYLPRSVIKYGSDGKLYCLICKNGTRMMDHVLACLAPNGREEWRTDIFNQYIDMFETSPEGKVYIAGYDYKLDEKKQVKYPFEVGRYTLLEVDENGNPKKLFDKKFEFNGESKQRTDYYLNQVAFDKENNPMFFFSTIFDVSQELNIGDKKFKKEKGEFLFLQFDKRGELVFDYQLKTGAAPGNKMTVPDGSLGLGKTHNMMLTKNNTWLINLPLSNTVTTKKSSYKPSHKSEIVFMEFDPDSYRDGKGTINWVSRIKTGTMGGGTSWFDAVNDSMFIGFARSNDTIDGVQLPYCVFASLKIKLKKEEEETAETDEVTKTEETINENTEADSTITDSSANTVTEIKTEETKTETVADTSKTEETVTENVEEKTDATAPEEEAGAGPAAQSGTVKLQLVPGPSGMILNISKSEIGRDKNANDVKVEVKDSEGSIVFEYETDMENGRARVNLALGNGGKGVLTLSVTAGGESADMKIVKM